MWKLDGNKARLETSQLSCHLDLASPSNGLMDLKLDLDSQPAFGCVDAALMQLTLLNEASLLADAYVRGNDLVATYAESAQRPCRTQVYWRFEHEHDCFGHDCFGIQLIVSVQTSRLDAAPELMVTSRVAGQARQVEPGTVVVLLPETDVCYAELADGSNVESTVVRDSESSHKLFPGSLEKGVIRRARILGCFLPAASVEQTARALHQRFIRSALPLTT